MTLSLVINAHLHIRMFLGKKYIYFKSVLMFTLLLSKTNKSIKNGRRTKPEPDR